MASKYCFLLFVAFFLTSVLFESVQAQGCVSDTGNDATIIFPASLNGSPLVAGDVITATTQSGLCVGSVTWAPGSPMAMTVWGDNDQTVEVDGLTAGETINFVSKHNGTRYPSTSVSFNAPATGRYTANALMVVGSISVAPIEVVPTFSTTTANLDFGSVTVNQTRQLQMSVTNQGGSRNLGITSVNSSNARYTISPTSASIAPGVSATFTVTFAPNASGAANGNLTFTHDGTGGSTIIPMTGTGVHVATFSTTTASLDFGAVTVGQNKPLQMTVSNPGGTRNLAVTNVTSSNGVYTVSPTNASIAPGGSATFTVTFTPNAGGVASGNVTFAHDGTGGTYSLPVTGSGSVLLPGAISVAPASVNFGNVNVNALGTAQVTVSHQGGSRNLTVNSVTSSNAVYTVSPASASIAPNGSATFTISFRPTANAFGVQNGTITFNHDGTGTATVSLTGTGVKTATFYTTTTTMNLGSAAVGQARTAQMTVTNQGGTRDLAITSVASSNAAFTVSPTSATVAPNATATFTVTFTPSAEGQATGNLSFSHDGSGGSASVSLTGSGFVPTVGTVSVSPGSYGFGSVNLSQSSSTQITLTHQGGTKDLSVSNVASSNVSYTVTPTSATLAPNSSKTFTVTFTPPSTEPQNGTLTFSHDGPGGSSAITLSGTGLQPIPGTLTVSPDNYDFGSVSVGSSSSVQVSVTNQGGNQSIRVTEAVSNNNQFTVNPSTATISPNQSRTFTITYTPGSTGETIQNGSITFRHDGSGSTPVLAVKGTGNRTATITLSPASLDMGSVKVGKTGTATVTVTNPAGSRDLNVTGVVSTNAVYTVSPNKAIVKPNGSATFTVTFKPATSGQQAGTLTFQHDGTSGQNVVSLTGYGTKAGRFQVSATSLDLGTIRSIDSKSMELTVTNDGGTNNINIARVTSSSNEFEVSPTTASIAPNSTETFTVTFVPSDQVGKHEAVISFQHDGEEAITNVTVAGTVVSDGPRGDLDRDDRVDILDIVKLLRITKGQRTATAEETFAADVAPYPNGNGVLDNDDLQLLINAVVTGQWPDRQTLYSQVPPVNYKTSPESEGHSSIPQLVVAVNDGNTTVSIDTDTPIYGIQLELQIDGSNFTEQVTRETLEQVNVVTALRDDGTVGLLAFEKDGNTLPASEFALSELLGDQIDTDDVTVVNSYGVDDSDTRVNLPAEVTGSSPTAEEEEVTLPTDYELSAAYPNPFNPQTNFTLSVVETQQVQIDIFDIRGARITTLYQGTLAAGTAHPFTFEAAGFSSGMYFIVAQGERFHKVRTVTLVK